MSVLRPDEASLSGLGINGVLWRRLGRDRQEHITTFSPTQINIVLIMAVSISAVSTVSAAVALYWFIRMKRSFRHQLIMMLLASDLFRACWFLVHPAIVLARGGVRGDSSFCQASGFLLAMATEASDFAVLMIAVHTALFVFKPPTTIGAGGLYKYRDIAYALWVIFAVLTAALAFVNPVNAYVSTGTFCYLPVRPFWYRLALAWVPRYLIFLAICTLYMSIYVYVRIKFKGFSLLRGRPSGSSSKAMSLTSSTDATLDTRKESNTRPASSPPQLQKPGLLPMSEEGLSTMDAAGSHKESILSTPRNNSRLEVGSEPSETGQRNSSSTTDILNAVTANDHSGRRSLRSSLRSSPRESGGADSSPPPSRGETQLAPYKGHSRGSSDQASANAHTAFDAQTVATHNAILRQLRFFFLYPLVYLLVWIIPLINHCLNYSDYFVKRPVFILSLLGTITLSSRGAIDACICCWKERPWTRLPTPRGERKRSGPRRWFTALGSFLAGKKTEGGREGRNKPSFSSTLKSETSPKPAPLWWEVEGKRRRDSVWMGTDSGIDEEGEEDAWTARKKSVNHDVVQAIIEEEEQGEGGHAEEQEEKTIHDHVDG